MLTVKAAAARAGVSEGLIRAWVADGTLPHYRLGAKGRRGKIAIAVDDLDRVLERFRVAGHATAHAPRRSKPIKLKHLKLG